MYNMDKANELHKNIRQMMGELKHEYDCLHNYLISKPDADEAYKKGLDEAWELARRIELPVRCGGFTKKKLYEIFGDESPDGIFSELTVSEALAKLRDYKARKKAEDEAVKVGDEVITDGGARFTVTFVWDDGKRCAGCDSDGEYCGTETALCRKTGRHFPEIAAVLEQMKGE